MTGMTAHSFINAAGGWEGVSPRISAPLGIISLPMNPLVSENYVFFHFSVSGEGMRNVRWSFERTFVM